MRSVLKVCDYEFYLPIVSNRVSNCSFYAQYVRSLFRSLPRGPKRKSIESLSTMLIRLGLQISIDERHTPTLYLPFLTSLLAKHKRDEAILYACISRDSQHSRCRWIRVPGVSTPAAATITNINYHKAYRLDPICDRCQGRECTGFTSVYGTEQQSVGSE
jgi:hypothetical protein